MALSLCLVALAAGIEALSRGRDAPLASEERWREALPAADLGPTIRQVGPGGVLDFFEANTSFTQAYTSFTDVERGMVATAGGTGPESAAQLAEDGQPDVTAVVEAIEAPIEAMMQSPMQIPYLGPKLLMIHGKPPTIHWATEQTTPTLSKVGAVVNMKSLEEANVKWTMVDVQAKQHYELIGFPSGRYFLRLQQVNPPTDRDFKQNDVVMVTEDGAKADSRLPHGAVGLVGDLAASLAALPSSEPLPPRGVVSVGFASEEKIFVEAKHLRKVLGIFFPDLLDEDRA